MFPLHCESDGYAFKRSLRLHSEETAHRNEKGVEVAMLPDTRLQLCTLLLLILRLEALILQLVMVVEGIIVHDTHVVNTISPYLSEVVYQHIPLLL